MYTESNKLSVRVSAKESSYLLFLTHSPTQLRQFRNIKNNMDFQRIYEGFSETRVYIILLHSVNETTR